VPTAAESSEPAEARWKGKQASGIAIGVAGELRASEFLLYKKPGRIEGAKCSREKQEFAML
jgi:hypothetical protein